MERKTTQVEVLQAVLARVIETVEGLNQFNAFLSIEPTPPEFPTHKLFATVAPLDGQFDTELLDGGGIHQCLEMTGVVITVYYRTHLDKNEHSENALHLTPESLLPMKRKLLKAFTNHDLESNSEPILSNLMQPNRSPASSTVRDESGQKISYVQLYFSTDFIWDLDT